MEKILYLAAGVFSALTAVAAFVSPSGAWPLSVVAISCVLIANLDRFSEVSASSSGIRAVVRDAKLQLDQLNQIAKLSAAAGLSLVQRTGRLGQFSYEEEEAFLHETLAALQSAGLSEQEITKLRDENWDRFVKFDYRHAILGGSQAAQINDPEILAEWKSLRNFDISVTPQQLEDFLQKCGCLQGPRKELLDEYRYYFDHRSHRNPEIWKRRREIGQIKELD